MLESSRLRRLTVDDTEIILSWRRQEAIKSMMYTDHEITSDEHLIWLASLEKLEFWPAFIFEVEGRPIGYSNLKHERDGRFFWGYYIGDPGAPKGSGTLMSYCSLELAFGEYDAQKVVAETFEENGASRGLLRKLGFQQEGMLREHVLKNAKRKNIALYGLLRSEWSEIRESIRSGIESAT